LWRSITTKNKISKLIDNYFRRNVLAMDLHFLGNFGSRTSVLRCSDWMENAGTIWENADDKFKILIINFNEPTRFEQFAVYGRL
jgi:hypothetical protein